MPGLLAGVGDIARGWRPRGEIDAALAAQDVLTAAVDAALVHLSAEDLLITGARCITQTNARKPSFNRFGELIDENATPSTTSTSIPEPTPPDERPGPHARGRIEYRPRRCPAPCGTHYQGQSDRGGRITMSHLSDFIRSQAEWRRQKAEEYPDDRRNANSADALDALADLVENAADEIRAYDHWALEILDEQAELSAATTGGVPTAGERVSRKVARFGFTNSPTPERFAQQFAIDFLVELVPDALADAYDLAAAGTPEPDRSDERLAELAEQYGLQEHEVSAALDGIELGMEYFQRRGKLSAEEQEAWIAECRAEQAVEEA